MAKAHLGPAARRAVYLSPVSACGICRKKKACQAGQCEEAGKVEGQARKPAGRAAGGCSSRSAVAPTAITPSCKLQQHTQAARAAPSTMAATAALSSAAATAAPLPPAATTAPQPAATVVSPAHTKVILSLKNVVRRETRSPSKKCKVERPSDRDPATPEGGSFTLLSQLDGADQSTTPPTPEPAPLVL